MKHIEIDWSKAPEDATHYGPDNEDWREAFYKMRDGEWVYFGKNGWGEERYIDDERIASFVERPQQKETLFTVGNEIQYQFKSLAGSQWWDATITYVCYNNGEVSGVMAKCNTTFGECEQWLDTYSTNIREKPKDIAKEIADEFLKEYGTVDLAFSKNYRAAVKDMIERYGVPSGWKK